MKINFAPATVTMIDDVLAAEFFQDTDKDKQAVLYTFYETSMKINSGYLSAANPSAYKIIRHVPTTKTKTIDPKYLPIVGGYDVETEKAVTFTTGEKTSMFSDSSKYFSYRKVSFEGTSLEGSLPTKEELATATNFVGTDMGSFTKSPFYINDFGDGNFELSHYSSAWSSSNYSEAPTIIVINNAGTVADGKISLDPGCYTIAISLSSQTILSIDSFDLMLPSTTPKKIPAEYLDVEYESIFVNAKIIDEETYEIEADQTYDQLVSLYDAGREIRVKMTQLDLELELLKVDEYSFVFGNMMETNMIFYVVATNSNRWYCTMCYMLSDSDIPIMASIDQKLSDGEKAQACYNAGAIPNICVDAGTSIGVFEVADNNKTSYVYDIVITCDNEYRIHKPGYSGYSIIFTTDSNGDLNTAYTIKSGSITYSVDVFSSLKMSLNTWRVSLGVNTSLADYIISPYHDIRLPIDIIENGNEYATANIIAATNIDSNQVHNLQRLSNSGRTGFVYNEVAMASSQADIRSAITNRDCKTIYCNYNNSPFDCFFISSQTNPSGSYRVSKGTAIKNGVIGSATLTVDGFSESYWSYSFTPLSYSPCIVNITKTVTDSVETYTADKTYEEIIDAANNGLVYAVYNHNILHMSVISPDEDSPIFFSNTASYDEHGGFSLFAEISSSNAIYVEESDDVRVPIFVDCPPDNLDNGMIPIMLPDSNGNNGWSATYPSFIRMVSSTSGSTKLFDITVDDSGTLTVTEVTS